MHLALRLSTCMKNKSIEFNIVKYLKYAYEYLFAYNSFTSDVYAW